MTASFSEKSINLLIASYLEPIWVEQIRAVSSRCQVVYVPELLPEPRYPCDHFGAPLARAEPAEARWRQLLARADILFDFDYTHMEELPDLAHGVRWIQATSAGIGQTVKRYRYEVRMPQTIFTTASGVHARPLAEFVLMAMTMHYKQARLLFEGQSQRCWERYAGTDLEGRSLGILGLGRIGSEVARFARLLGMRTYGSDLAPRAEGVDHFYPLDRWQEMLAHLDVLVLAVPHTPRTEKMIDSAALQLLQPGAYLVNIARGAVVDEQALLAALQSGHLSGAALDVFEHEPLPPNSPFWALPQVLVSPHSASTSDRENRRITDLFCENLERFLAGQPMRNVLDPEKMF